ncbi:spindle assembly abnormal protein 6 homolog [Polyodon spathula]|uniref:spindle assembly abnormal protein 6 homolog n=1 Tax=Polyodon spathula TaxID=7913 RepID=UPI001B7ED8F6|nr:spindle assembly abnormal protein 6 homolog [Polyodon spathula]
MADEIFCKVVNVILRCKDCEDRRASIRLTVETRSASNPVHKKDLIVRLTDDTDPFFLYNLTISEEDFQSLKCQQGLLVEFSSFAQRFIDLLEQCILEQTKEVPRFLLQLEASSSVLDRLPAGLNVIETNPFKHLTHLSLKLLPGNDSDVKKYLAICLKSLKTEKNMLEEKLHRTEDDLSKRLSITQQTLAEKTKELDRLRNEWSSRTSLLTNRHTQDVTAEREKSLQIQSQCQIKYEQQQREMEVTHSRAVQHLESRVVELESTNKELTERKYKSDSAIRELKAKLTGLEEDYHRYKQEVISLGRENSTLDSECHEKEKLLSQLRTRTAVLEQEVKDKEQVVTRTTVTFETAKEHKKKLEESVEHKQLLIGKFEATVKSLSEELLKANEIIKKLQGDMKKLMEKMKLKNAVTMQQEKLLTEKEQVLQKETLELDNLKHALKQKEDEASKLQEQLDSTAEKLDESKQLLKTNENVISWLNKQLNENKIASVQETAGFCDSAMPGSTSSKPSVMQNSLQQPPALYSTHFSVSPMPQQAPSAQPSDNYSKIFASSAGMHPASFGPSMIRHRPQVHFSPLSMNSATPSAFEQRPGPSTSSPMIPHASNKNDAPGLDMKYLQKSIPLKAQKGHNPYNAVPTRALLSNRVKPQTLSAYFPGQQPKLPAS